MGSAADTWWEERLRPAKRGTTLVLCRTRATATAARRWLARRGGALGIEVLTPAALAAIVGRAGPEDGAEVDPELPECALSSRIAGRPGLIAAARRWVEHLRAARFAEVAASAPTWLEELVGSGWAAEQDEAARVALLARARARVRGGGLSLGAAFTWDRLVAIGFDVPDAALDPWTRALVEALGVRRSGTPPAPVEIPSLEVADPLAEARVAARIASEDPHGTLILLSEETTARRLRDTLHRNGIPCAWRDTSPLAAHPVASAAARCVDWFGPVQGPDPQLGIVDLAFVFGATPLGRALHPVARRWVEARIAEAAPGPSAAPPLARGGRRAVREALSQLGLVDAPLSRWIARLERLRASPPEGADLRSTGARIALEARLRVLQACAAGQPLEVALPLQGPPWTRASAQPPPPAPMGERSAVASGTDDREFEALVVDLLKAQAPAEGAGPPPPHTLGTLQTFLLACRVPLAGDPMAQALVARLAARAAWPATPAHLREVLGGTTDPGEVAEGVELLHVEDYDGRPCARLVLVDVHDKGLARRPAPDPLLQDAEVAALGALTGPALVAHRLDQVHRAMGNAERTIAVVTRRDAGGRAVVAPIQLDLVPDPHSEPAFERPGTYGLALPVPELGPWASLEVVHGEAPRPCSGDPEVVHLALQATVEWYREGRGARTGPPRPRLDWKTSLARRLRRSQPHAPEWVLPYLGHAEGAPEAALPGPDREWSYSRLFRPLTHCLYQTWLTNVLALRPPEEVTQALDPREIGQAVHRVLEVVGTRTPWRARNEAERASLIEALIAEVDRSVDAVFADAVERFGELSPSRVASAAGQAARWKVQLRTWARERVRRIAPQPTSAELDQAVRSHPALLAAREAFFAAGAERGSVPYWVADDWLLMVAKELANGGDPRAWPDPELMREGDRNALPWAWREVARAFLDRSELGRLARVLVAQRRNGEVLAGALTATAVEVPFGAAEEAVGELRSASATSEGSLSEAVAVHLGPVRLALGREPVAVRGRIDRLGVVEGPRGPLVHLLDYKTGKNPPEPRVAGASLWSLEEPQLLVYALVLRQALAHAPPPLTGARVAALGWDWLREVGKPGRRGRLDAFVVDDLGLDTAAAELGWLLDEGRSGRWTLAPRPDACPALDRFSGHPCGFEGACRLRRLPSGEEA